MVSLVPEFSSGRRRSRRSSRLCGVKARSRPAPSSMARGNPSRRLVMPAMAAAFSGVTSKCGSAARARVSRSATASYARIVDGSAGTSAGGTCIGRTGNSCSPVTPSGARLVARTVSSGEPSSSRPIGPPAPATCSRLSRTSRSRRPASRSLRLRRPVDASSDAAASWTFAASRAAAMAGSSCREFGDAGQGDEDRAIGIAVTVVGRQTQRHARLADARSAGQGEQP